MQKKVKSDKPLKTTKTKIVENKENPIADIESVILNPELKRKTIPNNDIRFTTGNDLMDIMVGGGEGLGYPAGRIVNYVGDKSSGKTFCANEVVAANYYKYKNSKYTFKYKYDDCESGYSFNTKKMYGIDIIDADRSKRIRSRTVEELYCNVREFFESLGPNDIGIYVIDSLDGVRSKAGDKRADEQYAIHKGTKMDKDQKGSYKMEKPKYLSDTFFPQLADLIEQKNGLLVVISQVRCNIDPMSFEKFSRNGGKALDFYCHSVVWLANINKIKRKERAVGVTIMAKLTKSKTPRPYRSMYATIYFDYGLDNITTSADFLYDFLTDRGQVEKGASAVWDSAKEVSIENIKEFLIENKKEAYYRKNINAKLKKSEVIDWLNEEKNKALLKKYNAKFSATMGRNDLVLFIENNNLQHELQAKVVDKWELIEESIRTIRKPRYPQ